MPSLKVVQTADGSNTLFSEQYHAHYHSTNGALQESLHVFIKNGFDNISQNEIKILEVGFGTGLNATLTASSAKEKKRSTQYTGIDLYPPDENTLSELNYTSILNQQDAEEWKKIISAKWDEEKKINDYFLLKKINLGREDVTIIFINGIHGTYNSKISEGDNIALFPPVGGG